MYLAVALALAPALAAATESVGTGASFPAGLYQALSFAFQKDTGITMQYTALTSTKGKCRLKGYATCPASDTEQPHDVDWIGTTTIFSTSEYSAYPDLRSYPSFAGGVVAVYNLPTVPDLVLSRSVMARVFRKCGSGKTCPDGWIADWNHPDILALNPNRADELNAAGPISVVVWADKAGTTENFKTSLALWDSGFATQFAGQLNDGTTWPNVSVIRANTNRGVSSRVLVTPGAIGYVSLDEAAASGLPHAGLAQSYLSADGVLRATPDSVLTGLVEKGLSWGNNGDDPKHLTANAYGATGSEAWPIVGYTYFGIRNDTPANATDETCTHRKATLTWFEWFYTSPIASTVTRELGFAPLPAAARVKVLEQIRKDMLCRGVPVYQRGENTTSFGEDAREKTFYVTTTPELQTAVGLYVSAFTDIPQYSSLVVNVFPADVLEAGYPFVDDRNDESDADTISVLPSALAALMYQAEGPTEKGGARRMFPLHVAPFGVVYNLCDARLAVSCDPVTAKVDLVLTMDVLVGIMTGAITRWNDPALVAVQETAEQGAGLPNAPILIVGPVNDTRLVSSMLDLLGQRLGKDKVPPSAAQVARNITVEGFRQAVSTVAATQYGLTFASGPVNVFSDKAVFRVARFWDATGTVIVQGNASSVTACVDGTTTPTERADMVPIKASLYSSSQNKGCWPLVETYFMASVDDDEAEECYTGLPQVTAQLMDFMLKYSAPLELLGMVGVDGGGKQRADVSQRQCFGRSITNPVVARSGIPDELLIVVRFMGAAMTVSILLTGLFFFVRRDNKIIEKSPWWYLTEVSLGCAVQAAALIPLSFQQYSLMNYSLDYPVDQLDIACMGFPWLYGIGIALVYAPILSRTYKVHRIFRTSTMREVRNNTKLEVILQAAFFAPMIIILIVWTAVDPMVWRSVVVASDPSTGEALAVGGLCNCNNIEYFLSPLVGWVGLCIGSGLVVAYMNRAAGMQYKIIFNLFSLSVLMFEALILGIPIILLTSENLTANYAVKVVFVLFTSLSACWLLLFPVVSRVMDCGLFRSSKSGSRSRDTDERGGAGKAPNSKSSREDGYNEGSAALVAMGSFGGSGGGDFTHSHAYYKKGGGSKESKGNSASVVNSGGQVRSEGD